jgi:hypothetical protein
MRPTAVRAVLIAATLLSASAVRVGAQLTVTQGSACPAPALAAGDSISRDNTPARDTTARASSPNGQPDVVLLVAFSADELRFNSQPNARIRFCWGGDSLHVVERRNLPSPVVAGTTYRNVFIAAELRAYLNAECLSQRLGLSPTTGSARSESCAGLGLDTSHGVGKGTPRDTTSVLGTAR